MTNTLQLGGESYAISNATDWGVGIVEFGDELTIHDLTEAGTEIAEATDEHHIIVLRGLQRVQDKIDRFARKSQFHPIAGLSMTNGEYISFGSEIGIIEPFDGPNGVGYPDLDTFKDFPEHRYVGFRTRTHEPGETQSNLNWHTDRIFLQHSSDKSVLTVDRLPDSGGNTEFFYTPSMYHGLVERFGDSVNLHNLQVIYELNEPLEPGFVQPPPAVHPLILPGNAVYFQPSAFSRRIIANDGSLTPELAEEIFRFLASHYPDEDEPIHGQWMYSHAWQENDIVVFRNDTLNHRSRLSEGGFRLLRRLTLRNSIHMLRDDVELVA